MKRNRSRLRRAYVPGFRGLGYIPALDGLRALAVAAVLVYHSGAGWLPGGFLGVEIFFVISGYLITSLLINERASTRDTNLGAFWLRRARRLLPAVFLLIFVVVAYVAVFLPNELASLRGDAVAAMLYVSNWHLIFEDQSYFESFARPSLLQHLWSLAVEEQFYILWPILFATVFSRFKPRVAAAVTLAGVAASATLMFVLYQPGTDPSRLYYGTDTRIGGLLLGAALAFVWRPGGLPRTAIADRGIVDAFGAIAVVGLVAMCVFVGEYDPFLYQGGFVVTGLLTAMLIAAAVHPGPSALKSALGHPALVWIGIRSYSIYLWHWPVFMLTRPGVDVNFDGIALFAFRVAITLVLAEASYRFVETPIRRGGLGRAWADLRERASPAPFRTAVVTAAPVMVVLGAVSALSIAVVTADPPPPPESLAAGSVRITSWSQRDIDGRLALNIATATPEPVPVDSAPAVVPQEASVLTPAPGAITSAPIAPRVLAVGESVMLSATAGLLSAMPDIEIDAAISRNIREDIEVIRQRRDAGTLGDVVVLHIGNNGVVTNDQFAEIMDLLSAVPRVVWMNLKVPDRHWEETNNNLFAANVPYYPNATLIDWHSAGESHPEFFLEDGIHLEPAGYQYYAGLIEPYTR